MGKYITDYLEATDFEDGDLLVIEKSAGTRKIDVKRIGAIETSLRANAGFHNSLYRGKDITAYWTDGTLHKRIQGTDGFALFEDLFVGDYFATGSATIAGDTQSRYWVIAGFDLRKKVGSTEVSSHHVVLLPCNSDGSQIVAMYSSKMYDSVPFTGGYYSSKPCQDMLSGGDVQVGLSAIFGSNLLTSSELVSKANDSSHYNRMGDASGAATNWDWATVYATLLSEVEAYGSIVWSSSGYDGGMSSRGQLPLFRLRPDMISNRSFYFWLRDVVTGSRFAIILSDGRADIHSATNSVGICPRFLIK